MTYLTRLLAGLLLAACATVHADPLTVAVAANAEYVFNDLAAEFKKETGQDLKPVINSSGKFVTQIANGAPYDVFLSADMEFPQKLFQQGFATAAPKPYAYGALVVWTMKDLDIHTWDSALTSPAVGKIAIANPLTAPYGREAMKALTKAQLDQRLTPKLVQGESIAQTNQYIYSAVADVGMTAKSVVLAPDMKGKGKWVEVPRELYEPIAQGAVILKHGQDTNPKLAQQFYAFLYSDKARAILDRYGYLLP